MRLYRTPGFAKEESIWNKIAVGMLAVAMIAATRVWFRRDRPPELGPVETEEFKDVEELYAAGL